jgi:hypothetical protein
VSAPLTVAFVRRAPGAAGLALTLVVAAAGAGTGTASAQAPATTAAATAQTGDVMHVNADATFLRDGPNVRGKVVERLERGTRVEVVDRTAGDWWQVRAGDPPKVGYLHRLVLAPGEASVPARPRRPLLPPPSALPRAGTPGAVEPDADQPPRGPRPGGLAFVGVGVFSPTARDSFDAVGITGKPLVVGGGVEGTRLWRSLFVRGAVDWSKETGERTFLTDAGERFPLGIPLDIRMVPIDVTVGWRFDSTRPGAKPRRLVPYAGGGAGVLLYRETDEFAEGDEVVDETFASYHVLGGIDVYLQRSLAVRAEFRYRAVPDALGEGGVSAITGDTSLGGAVFFVGVTFGR